ncbi:MAG: UDP-glucose/GDP-mannose dehydrogenase family protein [Thermoleophilaceae bacterium]
MIGAGWVGLVTAACFAELGHDVYCRDIVAAKVESLSRGEVPIHETGLSELVARNAERLHFTTEMADVLPNASLLFCCVDTPPTYSGDADLSRVERVLEEVGDSADHALVMKSTVPVGTGRSIARRAAADLGYVSNPEFLKEGTAVEDFLNPERVVVGADAGSEAFGDRVEALYAPLGAPVVRTDVASAEMIKLASNAFLATKISFINEIANVSEELGADVLEVARGMGLDSRIGPKFLQAGIGYGGSCFPKDVSALKQLAGNSGYHFQLLTAVIEVNELQKRRTIGKLQKHLGLARGAGDRAARRGLQAEHRRRAGGHRAGAGRAAAGRGRPGPRLRPGGSGQRRRDARERAALRQRDRRARRGRRRGARDRVAGVRAARLVGRGQGPHGGRGGGRRAQLPRRRGSARGGLPVRGRRSVGGGAAPRGASRRRPAVLTPMDPAGRAPVTVAREPRGPRAPRAACRR